MPYIIVDRTAHTDAYQFINDSTTDLENICMTLVPYKLTKQATLPTPKIFEKKSDTQPYLARIRQFVRDEDDKAGYLNPIFNRKKAVYKVEKV